MKKRIWAYLLTLVMVVGLFPVSVLAEDVSKKSEESVVIAEDEVDAYGENALNIEKFGYDYDYNGDGVSDSWNISSKNNEEGQVVYAYLVEEVAEERYTLMVEGSGAIQDFEFDWVSPDFPWKDFCSYIYEIKIGNEITRIGNYFLTYADTNVKKLDLSTCTSLKEIGNMYDCGILEEVIFPVSLEKIEGFNTCTRLKSLDFSRCTNIEFGMDAFAYCKSLEMIDLSSLNLEKIPNTIFYGCSNLKEVKWPKNLKTIGYQAFSGQTTDYLAPCFDNGMVILPEGVEVIEQNAFCNNERLNKIILPESLVTIEKLAFENTGLIGVYIPENVSKIEDTAFSGLPEGSILYEKSRKSLLSSNIYTPSKTAVAVTNGGTFAEDTVFEAGKFATPIKEGYSVTWCTDETLQNEWSGDPKPGETYYAKWTLEKPEISVKGKADKTYDGKSVVLSVPEIDGAVYEWYKEDTTDVVSDKNTLELKEVVDSGIYFCKITVGADSVTTDAQVITIKKADPALTLSADSGSCRINRGPATFTYTSDSTGAVTVVSSDDTIATASVSGDTVTMELKAVGTASITVSVAGDENHTDGTATYQLTVQKKKKSGSSDSSSGTGSSATEQEHSVSKSDGIDNGKVKTDPAKAEKGDKVTVTVTPDEGYMIDRVTAKDADGKKIELTEKGEGKYTFTMPDSKVEIDAKFVKAEAEPAAPEKIPATEKIVLTINERAFQVFGNVIVNDVAPMIQEERAMLPIRFLAQALGAEVAWDDALNKVTITKDDGIIELYIGSPVAVVDGENIELDAPALIENSRTYLPLRFVAEHLGAKVLWDAETQQVTILPQP